MSSLKAVMLRNTAVMIAFLQFLVSYGRQTKKLEDADFDIFRYNDLINQMDKKVASSVQDIQKLTNDLDAKEGKALEYLRKRNDNFANAERKRRIEALNELVGTLKENTLFEKL